MTKYRKEESWAVKEFEAAELGDKRLTNRLIKIADKFSLMP